MIYLPSSTQLPVRKSGHKSARVRELPLPGQHAGSRPGTAFLLFISFKSSGNVFSTSCNPQWLFGEPCDRLKFEPRMVPRIPLTLPHDRCAGCAFTCVSSSVYYHSQDKRKCTVNLEPTCCVYLPEDLRLVSLLIFWTPKLLKPFLGFTY